MAGSCCDTAVAQESPDVPALAGLLRQYASFTASSLIFAWTTVNRSLCDLPSVCFDELHNSCNHPATCLCGAQHIKIRVSMASCPTFAGQRVAWREHSWILPPAVNFQHGVDLHQASVRTLQTLTRWIST